MGSPESSTAGSGSVLSNLIDRLAPEVAALSVTIVALATAAFKHLLSERKELKTQVTAAQERALEAERALRDAQRRAEEAEEETREARRAKRLAERETRLARKAHLRDLKRLQDSGASMPPSAELSSSPMPSMTRRTR